MNADVSCVNIFAEKDGYTIHFKLVASDLPHEAGESDLAALMKGTTTMLTWMKLHDYVHDSSRDRRGGGRAPQPPPTITNADGETVEVKCGQCGGAVYDNRQKNEERVREGKTRMPIFKCKNQSCGWVQWPEKAA